MMSDKNYYVYAYADPTSKSIFYIGKGQGNRLESHIKEHEKCRDQNVDENSFNAKITKINEIRKSGKEPLIKVLAKNLDNQEALLVESAFIWMYRHLDKEETLTNIAAGCYTEHFRPLDKPFSTCAEGFESSAIYRFSVGDPNHLSWEIARMEASSYITAGKGKKYSDAIKRLAVGDIVCAYVPDKGVGSEKTVFKNRGYLAIGKVLDRSKPIREISDLLKKIEETPTIYPCFEKDEENKDNMCYGAKVKWLWQCENPEKPIHLKGTKKIKENEEGYMPTANTRGIVSEKMDLDSSKWKPLLTKLEEISTLNFRNLIEDAIGDI